MHGLRINAIILNGIAGTHHAYLLQAGNGAQKGQLHILGQRRTHSLHVIFVHFGTARLQKELMPLFFGEAHHFVLDAGTIAGSNAMNDAAVQRRAIQIGADHIVGGLVGLYALIGTIVTILVFLKVVK